MAALIPTLEQESPDRDTLMRFGDATQQLLTASPYLSLANQHFVGFLTRLDLNAQAKLISTLSPADMGNSLVANAISAAIEANPALLAQLPAGIKAQLVQQGVLASSALTNNSVVGGEVPEGRKERQDDESAPSVSVNAGQPSSSYTIDGTKLSASAVAYAIKSANKYFGNKPHVAKFAAATSVTVAAIMKKHKLCHGDTACIAQANTLTFGIIRQNLRSDPSLEGMMKTDPRAAHHRLWRQGGPGERALRRAIQSPSIVREIQNASINPGYQAVGAESTRVVHPSGYNVYHGNRLAASPSGMGTLRTETARAPIPARGPAPAARIAPSAARGAPPPKTLGMGMKMAPSPYRDGA